VKVTWSAVAATSRRPDVNRGPTRRVGPRYVPELTRRSHHEATCIKLAYPFLQRKPQYRLPAARRAAVSGYPTKG
jgi:hypothetical protein